MPGTLNRARNAEPCPTRRYHVGQLPGLLSLDRGRKLRSPTFAAQRVPPSPIFGLPVFHSSPPQGRLLASNGDSQLCNGDSQLSTATGAASFSTRSTVTPSFFTHMSLIWENQIPWTGGLASFGGKSTTDWITGNSSEGWDSSGLTGKCTNVYLESSARKSAESFCRRDCYGSKRGV